MGMSGQWLALGAPAYSGPLDACSFGRLPFVVANAYPLLLLALTLVFAVLNRSIKRNYKVPCHLLTSIGLGLRWVG